MLSLLDAHNSLLLLHVLSGISLSLVTHQEKVHSVLVLNGYSDIILDLSLLVVSLLQLFNSSEFYSNTTERRFK